MLFPKFFLLPITIAVTSAAIPALICTTVPPAKSNAPLALSHPPIPHTQLHTGSYTNVAQSKVKSKNALNFILSANAPIISAGVIIANIA